MEFKHMYNQLDNIDVLEPDVYFKFVCFYNAKTELHNRTLTDIRSPYDKTEAYIVGENRTYSNLFAKSLYNWIVNYIRLYTKQPFSRERWNKAQLVNYSAQGWIDVFNFLKRENNKVIVEIEKEFKNRGNV